jgi:hypothetical protein
MGLAVEYVCGATAAMDAQLSPHLQIVNNGSSSVNLSTLTIRYYFTKDTCTGSLVLECDYAVVGNTNISGTFATTTGMNADEYAEVSFKSAAGSLAAGASTGEIQLRIHTADYCTFNQANDYSFDPTKTSYTNWSNVTLYQSGTLVWGTEP